MESRETKASNKNLCTTSISHECTLKMYAVLRGYARTYECTREHTGEHTHTHTLTHVEEDKGVHPP